MKNTTSQKLSLAGSVLTALTASLCCLGPLVAVGLGLGSFGAAAAVEQWRPYLLALTVLLLAVSFYLVYRPAAQTCAEGDCPPAPVGRWNKLVLWSGTLLVIGFGAFPYYAEGLVRSNPTTVPVRSATPPADPIATATLPITGMTCAGCTPTVKQSLARIPGVQRAEVSFAPPQARVTYDPKQVNHQMLTEAIRQAGYETPAEPAAPAQAPAKPGAPNPAKKLSGLREDFNREADKVRLLLLLSPS